MVWLQAKAFHHHETMNQLHDRYTTILGPFGTSVEQEAHLIEAQADEQMASHGPSFHDK